MTLTKVSVESVLRVGPESAEEVRVGELLGGGLEVELGSSAERASHDTCVQEPFPPAADAAHPSLASRTLGCEGSTQVGDRPGSCRDNTQ